MLSPINLLLANEGEILYIGLFRADPDRHTVQNCGLQRRNERHLGLAGMARIWADRNGTWLSRELLV